MNIDGLLEKRAQEAETEQEQATETKPKKSPYRMMIKELNGITNLPEMWAYLCDFALENLQQLYGLWLSTCMAGETLRDRIEVGKHILPSVQKQKDLVDEAAKRQAEAQAVAQAQFQAQQQAGGIAVPQGYVSPPTKRGRRGRKQ